MQEFFEIYGTQILAAIMSICGTITAVLALIKQHRSEKSVVKYKAETTQAVQITRDGIVKAFQEAHIPTEWKISLSQQIDTKLDAWAEKFLTLFLTHEKIRTELAIYNSYILANTAAYNKLTDEQKAHLHDLLNQITELEKTIEV